MKALVRWTLLLAPLVVALLGWRNGFDAVLRGKWVRHWGTEKGEHTATLCLPAQDLDEVAAQIDQLPGKLEALKEVGATVVAVDLSAFGGPSTVGTEAAHGHMRRSWFPRAALAAEGPVDGVWPLALKALADFEGAAPRSVGHEGVFMPYEVPFLHWDRPEEWGIAQGRIVFVGACALDRELTRFGRQPGPVAHSELVETLVDGVRPHQPWAIWDLLVAALVGLACAGARRLVPRAGMVLPALLGAAAVLALLVVAQQGLWLGLSGAALAALTWPAALSSRALR